MLEDPEERYNIEKFFYNLETRKMFATRSRLSKSSKFCRR